VHIGKPLEFPEGSDAQEFARVLERSVAELGWGQEQKPIAKAHAAGE
jgi:hypothetical protein